MPNDPSRGARRAMVTLIVAPGDLERARVEVTGDDYRHLFRARRLAVGDRLRIVDGRGNARRAEVERVSRRSAELAVVGPAPTHEPTCRLELWVAALRAERASQLVEKTTEIGVFAIRFIASERTPRQYGVAHLERLRRVAAAAVVQCHRARVPEIAGVDPSEVWTRRLQELPASWDRSLLHTASHAESTAASWPGDHDAGVVLIGPEGGWSDAEAAELERLGCRAVHLGPRILRVETAAVVAAARFLL